MCRVSFSVFVALFVTFLFVGASRAIAQPMPAEPEHKHEHGAPASMETLADQIAALRQQVSELQTKILNQPVDTGAMIASGGERRMKAMGASGGTGASAQGSAAMPAQMPDMMAGMMSMMSSMMGGMGGMSGGAGGAPMGQAGSMGSSTFLSSLPGYPGASHLYHVGATNFFLDHPEHITPSLEQQSRLSEIRTKSLISRAEMNRKIEQGEEELWLLTAADQPQYTLIEAKVRELEKLRADLRLSFIKDVGQATSVLTDEQRRAVLGQTMSAPVSAPSSAMAPSTSGTAGAMGDM